MLFDAKRNSCVNWSRLGTSSSLCAENGMNPGELLSLKPVPQNEQPKPPSMSPRLWRLPFQ